METYGSNGAQPEQTFQLVTHHWCLLLTLSLALTQTEMGAFWATML